MSYVVVHEEVELELLDRRAAQQDRQPVQHLVERQVALCFHLHTSCLKTFGRPGDLAGWLVAR